MIEPTLPALPNGLPWQLNPYLLLDGVRVNALPRQLYQWSDAPIFSPLFLGTRWKGLADLSPCLVALQGRLDPILPGFLSQAARESGYLIFTSASFDKTLQHLRGLLEVNPGAGQTAHLRLADPAAVQPLFALGERAFFGPIEQVCLPDGLERCWHWHQRSGPCTTDLQAQPYRLSEAELAALEAVPLRQLIKVLDQHLRAYFPAYLPGLSGADRHRHLRTLTSQGFRQGLCSERDMLLFANISAFLGGLPAENHVGITYLLDAPSPLSPSQRVEQAARLAERHATHREQVRP
ncbi:DUF4123 domain-containing protein [Pseudomonas typographi]|uniref:DUF4123 domain-containing protein n=1 Tax=Pseudomonas typographi TaxID=2715964 RepID=UPI0016876351|nr:DUF4123 domain-containing protein [Pseudomonas typographi]MBD1588068.1 DUF4123 domain-containing protein [Pseudomonas typographi]